MDEYSNSNALIVLGIFVLIGMIIASIYDFFRAYRKVKSRSLMSITIQDILFCIISTIIFISSVIFFLREQIRIYILIGMLIGGVFYYITISKYINKFYTIIIKSFTKIIKYIFIPFIFHSHVIKIMYARIEKYVVKCCKYIKNMIIYNYKIINKGTKVCLSGIKIGKKRK